MSHWSTATLCPPLLDVWLLSFCETWHPKLYVCSLVIIFLLHLPPFQCQLAFSSPPEKHCVFYSILPAFQAYLTSVLLASAAGLCPCTMCHQSCTHQSKRRSCCLAQGQVTAFSSPAVTCSCERWRLLAPPCTFISLHAPFWKPPSIICTAALGSLEGNSQLLGVQTTQKHSALVWVALCDNLSGFSRQPLSLKGVSIWGTGQAVVVFSRYTSKQNIKELFGTCFSAFTKYYLMAGTLVSWRAVPGFLSVLSWNHRMV